MISVVVNSVVVVMTVVDDVGGGVSANMNISKISMKPSSFFKLFYDDYKHKKTILSD